MSEPLNNGNKSSVVCFSFRQSLDADRKTWSSRKVLFRSSISASVFQLQRYGKKQVWVRPQFWNGRHLPQELLHCRTTGWSQLPQVSCLRHLTLKSEMIDVFLTLLSHYNLFQVCRAAPLHQAQRWQGSGADEQERPLCHGGAGGYYHRLWSKWWVQLRF